MGELHAIQLGDFWDALHDSDLAAVLRGLDAGESSFQFGSVVLHDFFVIVSHLAVDLPPVLWIFGIQQLFVTVGNVTLDERYPDLRVSAIQLR